MKTTVIALAVTLCTAHIAMARSGRATGPQPVQSSYVEHRVAGLANERLTGAFDADFKEVVALIHTLHRQPLEVDRVDAVDLAVSAFNDYVDHHGIVLPMDEAARAAKARQAAAAAGLLDILGW
jgi:hypothetical protein